jgi:site-specific recombinase XerD
MRQDLKLRNYSPHTIEAYVRSVAQFAQHFGTPPDRLGPEHIRTYQLFLIEDQKVSWSTFIQTVCALRFFYDKTLGRPGMVDHIPFPKKPKTLPVILSRDEVQALLLAPKTLKHRAILATLYTTGVRVSELCQLQGTDVDSTRMVIRVRQGKGKRDRLVGLSPDLLPLLRGQIKQMYQNRNRTELNPFEISVLAQQRPPILPPPAPRGFWEHGAQWNPGALRPRSRTRHGG